MEMTITEAFAELKLIAAKLQKKTEVISQNLVRANHVPDPFGDTKKMITEEMQAINDLEKNFVKIKSAISKANLETSLTVEGETKSIYEWILWRRDIAVKKKEFLTINLHNIAKAVKQEGAQPQVYKDPEGKHVLVSFVYNVDQKEWQKKQEEITAKLERLDGQLSLINATTKISF